MANLMFKEIELVDTAISWLQSRLPDDWKVGRQNRHFERTSSLNPPSELNSAIEIQANDNYVKTIAIDVRLSFTPRDAENLASRNKWTIERLAEDISVLVVTPWLSERTQDLLFKYGINYLDMAGNALIKLDNPALFLQTQGAKRNPKPTPRGLAKVRGPKAGRLIRLLVDISPPYGVGEIANFTKIGAGYISRLLDSLDREALVERGKGGRVENVAIKGLLEKWAESYEIFRSNNSSYFVSPTGPEGTLNLLSSLPADKLVAVTGSFAAVRIAPVAAPTILALYCQDISAVAQATDLLPADRGANVVLLNPFDRVVYERTAVGNTNIHYVAPSQAAVDCLTGNGRMPSEGTALIDWMVENESAWRLSSLSAAKGLASET